jgi:isopenicillin N synthase-like dioxygenase
MPASHLDIAPWIPPTETKQKDIEWASLHTLDLSKVGGDDFTEVPDSVVEEVGRAFNESGFIYAENHGLDYEDVLRQFAIGQYAFNNVSQEDKSKYKADIIKTGSFVGYKEQGHWKIDGVKDTIEVR